MYSIRNILSIIFCFFLLSCDSNNESLKEDLIDSWLILENCYYDCNNLIGSCSEYEENDYEYYKIEDDGYFENCIYESEELACTDGAQYWTLHGSAIQLCGSFDTGLADNVFCLPGIITFSEDKQTLTINSSGNNEDCEWTKEIILERFNNQSNAE